MPVTDIAPVHTCATNERLAELVQHLTACSHLAALDAVDDAARRDDDTLRVVARAVVEVRPRPPTGRLRLKPRLG